MSNALGAGGNPARMAALAAGLRRVSGISIEAQYAGGLDAVALAAAYVDAGLADAVIAGGAESYSQRPLRALAAPEGGAPQFYLQPPFTPFPQDDVDMTEAADRLARAKGISRAKQEEFAVESHRKARAAQALPQPEIVPLAGVARDPSTRTLTPRIAARSRVLAGSVSAATTAVEADGAALCLIVSDALAQGRGGVRMRAHRAVGEDPGSPGIAPVAAIAAVLAMAGIEAGDLTGVELMEAHAAQAIACAEGGDLPPEITNLVGGALARGHPIEASGTVLICRALHELRARPGLALCAIAAAGGIGSAMVLEGIT